MPKFSIITCTYNSGKYLEKNIYSVKDQNFKDFEHIFIDAFSTDNTIDIINKYKEEFPDKVKFFQSKPEGISNAMNKGIDNSTGEYLIHLHSDDSFFDKKVLGDVNCFLEIKNYPDWIYGKISVFNKEKVKGVWPSRNIFKKNKINSLLKTYLLKFYNYIPHQAVFIKKDVFNKFGFFDERLRSGMDPDFWLRVRKKTDWLFFDRVISNFCLRSDAQSSGVNNKKINRKNIIIVKKRHLNKFEFLLFILLQFLLDFKSSNNYQK
jgi:glycosyltransferase involved in cell wall biosynthesis